MAVMRMDTDLGEPRGVALDRDLPVLVFKIGSYPFDHGGLGIVRSLGRAGVPVDAVVESSSTPTSRSRFLRTPFVWPTTGAESRTELLDDLVGIGQRLDRTPVLIPTDDEAATLVSDNREALRPYFRLLVPRPGLAGRVASKRGLYETCVQHGTDTPAARFPTTRADVLAAADDLGYPVIVKNLEPWSRLERPSVPGTTLVRTRAELDTLSRRWAEPCNALLQTYLPPEHCEDWAFHGCFDATSHCVAGFTGRKLRSWPMGAGVTAHAVTVDNRPLVEESIRLARAIGYEGIADMDWRYDTRNGRYHLVDFNPRIGAQFRLFENAAGVDVVRALHLLLAGRPVPSATCSPRRFSVETLDLVARRAYRRAGGETNRPRPAARGWHERAWWAKDDPAPAALALLRFGTAGTKRVAAARKSLR